MIDVGGTPFNWALPGAALPGVAQIVLVNLARESAPPGGRCVCVRARAEALPFRDGSFDAAFSNSVLEHLPAGTAREGYASELRRVAARLFVQTPARSFPLEPHLLGIGLHYLPRRWQRRLIRWTTLWGWIARPGARAIERFLAGTQLLGRRELAALFPGCRLERERFLGLTKAYRIVRGVGPAER